MVPVEVSKGEILKVADILRLFTPETLCNVVVRALRAVQCEVSRGRGSAKRER
jgi:hypothetical protein